MVFSPQEKNSTHLRIPKARISLALIFTTERDIFTGDVPWRYPKLIYDVVVFVAERERARRKMYSIIYNLRTYYPPNILLFIFPTSDPKLKIAFFPLSAPVRE